MIEIEIKIAIDNKDAVIRKLVDIGFVKGTSIKESDDYYTSDYYDVKLRGEALRIRMSQSLSDNSIVSTINFKGKRLDGVSMSRNELETELCDGEIGRKILEALGFYVAGNVTKIRDYYHKDKVTACVDSVEGLGDYLELEILADSEEKRESSLVLIYTVLDEIGLKRSDTVTTSYLSMIMGVKDE